MKGASLLATIVCASTLVSALPPSYQSENNVLEERTIPETFTPQSQSHDLEKRRGGGGGRGGGGSGGRSGGSSGSGAGGRPISSYSFSPQSNLGGRTRDGSGTPPAYGGRYSGGAAVPYTSGQRSPTRGVTPFLLPITALAFFPALWLFPVFAYPYAGYGYHWYDGGRNRTANVTCLCQEYSVCGCDPGQDNQTVIAQQLTNGAGSGAPVNSTNVRVIDYGDGNTTAYINGTLDNGTTASGGTDPSNADQISAAVRLLAGYGGYWVAAVVASLFITVA